jgi:hypothetical protein
MPDLLEISSTELSEHICALLGKIVIIGEASLRRDFATLAGACVLD